MMTINQASLFDDSVYAVPSNVQVNEEGYTATIQEDEAGEVSIPEWKLATAARRVVSKALCYWKYGLEACS